MALSPPPDHWLPGFNFNARRLSEARQPGPRGSARSTTRH